jgi:hypothetical protein
VRFDCLIVFGENAIRAGLVDSREGEICDAWLIEFLQR